jgi:NAD(P)-dependent dehydrogenase (short-subunit alcohol dehydrogenase family)
MSTNVSNPTRVVVTGAARGIGHAVALRLASEGRELVLVDLRDDELGVVRGEALAAGSPAVRALVADLADREQLRRLADELAADPPDGLVNVAGSSTRVSAARPSGARPSPRTSRARSPFSSPTPQPRSPVRPSTSTPGW